MDSSPSKKYLAEALGTAVLTLFGCGVATLLTGTKMLTGFEADLAIAMAFGLSIVSMAYVIGNISGCHINPAVSLGVFFAGKMSGKDLAGYLIAQFIGGFIGAFLLWAFISCADLGGVLATGLGCDGYGKGVSSVDLNVYGAILVEVVLTFVFVFTVLGVTSSEKFSGVAGIVIGLTLTFVHLLGIPLTGTSVNPARSVGPALMMAISGNATPLLQVWVFILAPAIGGILAALVFNAFYGKAKA